MWTDFLAAHARRDPERPALILADEDRTLSYADLDEETARWATFLGRQGLGSGDRLAFLAQNCLEHLTLFFACTRLGVIFVPLNFRLGIGELEEQLERLETSLLIVRGETRPACEAPVIDLDEVTLPRERHAQTNAIAPDDTLLMLFTSGSTGLPKGVMLHAEMLLWNIINTNMEWELSRDDVSVVHMPFFHTGGYNVTCLPLLYLGGTLVMTARFDAGRMLRIIEREQISFFFAVPTMYLMMQEHPDFTTTDLSSLRACLSGGAPCPSRLIEAWRERGAPLRQGFGLTEVGPNCFSMSDEDARTRPDSIGRPMLSSRVKLVDEEDREVPIGEIGELCIKGPHVTRGYWRMDDVFAEVCEDGWFHTGDLMRCDERGFFYVAGRRKDMYISGGENVYPGEVLRQLVMHPDILEALVIAVPDERWGEVGYAFYRGNPDLDLARVRTFLDSKLSRYKHPHYLTHLDSFPLLPNNKVDIRALKARALREVNDG